MLCDEKVLFFDFDEFVVEEIRKDLEPYYLRGRLKDNNSMKNILYNVNLLKEWLTNRVLSLSRSNAKQIYAMFRIPQRADLETRVNVCLKCKGVSITDSYWVSEDNESFSDVNIRTKHFNEIVDVSLYGCNPTATTNYVCPDLTTQGLFRKAWIRNDDIYLLKSDNTANNINTRMEVLASQILDCFVNKIDCVSYSGRVRNTKQGKLYVDKCQNFVTEEYSFVEAYELYVHENYQDFFNTIPYSGDIAVLDYILMNTDRHLQNYGFLMSNRDGKIAGLAPLFDFNLALVADYLGRDVENTLSQMFNDGKTYLI